MSFSRRSFLKQTSGAIAAAGLFGQAPGPWLWAANPADLVGEPDEALLRKLALAAMDAARSAGASFADIRVCDAREVGFEIQYWPHGDWMGKTFHRPWPNTDLVNYYGIRAIVEGTWGFATGNVMTSDAVADTARAAVGIARRNRARRRRPIGLAPASTVENGEWETQIEQDPFAVSLYEQRQLVETVFNEAIPGPMMDGAAVSSARMGMTWLRATTVFASIEGALVLQRIRTASPGGGVRMNALDERQNPVGGASSGLRSIRRGPYGYEAVGDAETLIRDMREAVDRAAARARAARDPITTEIGRYDLVLDSGSVANLLLASILPALDLRRALGYEANRDGTSFAAPPAEMLGKYQMGSELLTVHCDRTQPKGAATVGWDDEGVRPEAYTPVKNGVIMDYHNDRETAMALADWYRSRGEPVRAHGVVRGWGRVLPAPLTPNVTLEPGKDSTIVDDLIAGTKRGFYVEGAGGRSDQQLLNTQFQARPINVRRITNGKLEEHVKDFAFQFITPRFWKNVDGLGDETTAVARTVQTDSRPYPGKPFPYSTVRTVPMRVREVDVLNTGRTG